MFVVPAVLAVDDAEFFAVVVVTTVVVVVVVVSSVLMVAGEKKKSFTQKRVAKEKKNTLGHSSLLFMRKQQQKDGSVCVWVCRYSIWMGTWILQNSGKRERQRNNDPQIFGDFLRCRLSTGNRVCPPSFDDLGLGS